MLPIRAIDGVPLPAAHVLEGPLALPKVEDAVPDGLLGADLLSGFDLDIDLAAGRLGLYEPQVCAAASPAWPGPFVTVFAKQSLHQRLFFQARLDGHPLAVFFDTGSQGSVVDARTAASFGVTPAVLATDPEATARGVTANAAPARRHRFASLEIGGTVERDPELIVTRLGLVDADLVLGVDYMLTRRVWLSYAGRRIFLGHAH